MTWCCPAAGEPDYGMTQPVPHWHGTPAAHAEAGGLSWDVLLVTDDPYLDRYTLPMSADLDAGQLDQWRQRVQGALEVLVRQHRWAAGPVAIGVWVIVPLTPQSETDLISATSPAAFGAIATSWPPDPVTLAETLVHEFQHVKLCGLLDMVPLATSGGQTVYAPWRQDPGQAGASCRGSTPTRDRPLLGGPSGRPRPSQTTSSAPRRSSPAGDRPSAAVDTLLRTGCLTAEGERFTELVRAAGGRFAGEPVPGRGPPIAREVALDHWLTWQIQHVAADARRVASLADAYRAGEPRPRPVRQDVDPGRRPQARLQRAEPPAGHALPRARAVPRAARGGTFRSASPIACCSPGTPSRRARIPGPDQLLG